MASPAKRDAYREKKLRDGGPSSTQDLHFGQRRPMAAMISFSIVPMRSVEMLLLLYVWLHAVRMMPKWSCGSDTGPAAGTMMELSIRANQCSGQQACDTIRLHSSQKACSFA